RGVIGAAEVRVGDGARARREGLVQGRCPELIVTARRSVSRVVAVGVVPAEKKVVVHVAARSEVAVQLEDGARSPPPVLAVYIARVGADAAVGRPLVALLGEL